MILELADLRIQPGQQAAFEQAVEHGLNTVISKAKGFQHYEIRRSIESPDRYVLEIMWDTLEDHTVGFRGSPAMTAWRAIVSPFFAQPPAVEHFDFVARSRA
jgi:heme-degrading monooxygenase HmoA